jgi:hypothetical protein
VLRALTASALALPGLGHEAAAESAPVEMRADYRYSSYAEDDLSGGKVATGGERSRYEIDIHQFHFETPLGERFDLGIDVNHETMSGATPWYVTPGASGEDPVQVMTEATISETRTDALLSSRYYMDQSRADLAAGFSVENDYRAINGSLGGQREFNEKHTTLSGGIGASFDEIEPSGRDRYPTRVASEDKQSYDAFLGISQVLGRSTNVQTSLTAQHARGYLSDPYKLSFVASAPLRDARPDDRNQLAWLTRLRHHFGKVGATLHLDYQYFVDDWEINSHTFEFAWYQELFERIRLTPAFRYYSQSQAYFYAPFYAVQRRDGLRSSDYRLSPFGALSYGLEADVQFHTGDFAWNLSAGWDRYESSGDLALGSVGVENPGLVSYNLLTLGLTARF